MRRVPIVLLLLLFGPYAAVASAVTWYAQSPSTLVSTGTFNTVSSGTGTSGGTASFASGDSVNSNGIAMTLDCPLNLGTGTLTVSSSVGGFTVSGTQTLVCANTRGVYANAPNCIVLTVPASTSMSITGGVYGAGAGAKAIVQTGGSLTITNTASTPVDAGFGIVGVSLSGTGVVSLTVNGNILATGFAIYGQNTNASNTATINGNVTALGTGVPVLWVGGIFNLNGLPLVTGALGAGATGSIYISGGTCNWGGAQSLSSTQIAYISQAGGLLNVTSPSALALSNSGSFIYSRTGGTLSSSGAAANNMISTAAVVQQFTGGTGTLTVNSAVIPAGANVATSAGTFGFAGAPVSPGLVVCTPSNVATVQGNFGIAGTMVPTLGITASNLLSGISVANTAGSYIAVAGSNVLTGVAVGPSGSGTLTLANTAYVDSRVPAYGPGGSGWGGGLVTPSGTTVASIQSTFGIANTETASLGLTASQALTTCSLAGTTGTWNATEINPSTLTLGTSAGPSLSIVGTASGMAVTVGTSTISGGTATAIALTGSVGQLSLTGGTYSGSLYSGSNLTQSLIVSGGSIDLGGAVLSGTALGSAIALANTDVWTGIPFSTLTSSGVGSLTQTASNQRAGTSLHGVAGSSPVPGPLGVMMLLPLMGTAGQIAGKIGIEAAAGIIVMLLFYWLLKKHLPKPEASKEHGHLYWWRKRFMTSRFMYWLRELRGPNDMTDGLNRANLLRFHYPRPDEIPGTMAWYDRMEREKSESAAANKKDAG